VGRARAMQEYAELAVGKSHVTSRHLNQIADTAYDATIPAL